MGSKETEEAAASAQSQLERPPFSFGHEVLFVIILCFAQFMTQASLAQALAPLHIIGDSFDTLTPGQLSWFIAAYSLTVGTFILPAGRTGDCFGHRRVILCGYAWYSLWSLIAGLTVFTKSSVFFDVCRGLQGIGPAILLPNAIAILGRTYPPGPRKSVVFSLFGGVAPNGFIFGAVFSSLIAQLAWWPWIFWVNAVFAVVLGIACYLILPADERNSLPPCTFEQLDVVGSTLGVAGLVLVNVAWNQGPTVGWSTPYTYVLLIVGLLVLAAFFCWEARAKNPILPFRSFAGDTGFVLACIAVGWSTFGIFVYYLWQFFEVLRHESPLLVSAQLVPVGFSGMAAAITTGYLLQKWTAGWVMLCAMLAFTIGTTILATTPVDQTYWAQTFVCLIIIPWGMDMSFPSATIVLSNSMPREHQGIAASLVATVVNYSISIGLGIAGTVESNVNKDGKNNLKGYRSAWYTGIGLGIAGIFVALSFIMKSRAKSAEKS